MLLTRDEHFPPTCTLNWSISSMKMWNCAFLSKLEKQVSVTEAWIFCLIYISLCDRSRIIADLFPHFNRRRQFAAGQANVTRHKTPDVCHARSGLSRTHTTVTLFLLISWTALTNGRATEAGSVEVSHARACQSKEFSCCASLVGYKLSLHIDPGDSKLQ